MLPPPSSLYDNLSKLPPPAPVEDFVRSMEKKMKANQTRAGPNLTGESSESFLFIFLPILSHLHHV
jgi:hypothetical protein